MTELGWSHLFAALGQKCLCSEWSLETMNSNEVTAKLLRALLGFDQKKKGGFSSLKDFFFFLLLLIPGKFESFLR